MTIPLICIGGFVLLALVAFWAIYQPDRDQTVADGELRPRYWGED